MPYGLLLELICWGLGLHYILSADASPRSKTIVGGLLVASLLFGRWMPVYFSLAIQTLVSFYVLMLYRIQGASSE